MVIDGKKIAGEMLINVAEEVKKLTKPPRLAAVLVGDTGNGRKFLELKKKAAEGVGIEYRIYEFPAAITTQKLRKEIVGIAKAGINDGVIVELPLPAHINTQYVLNAIPAEKDIDVLSEKSQGAFFAGRSSILPPAVEAVKIILEKHGIDLKGKNCAIFGYGLLVGKPVSHWLAQEGATVSIINEFTPDPAEMSKYADIVISGVGKANLVKADMIKERAVVIDFGYKSVEGSDFSSKDLDRKIVNPRFAGQSSSVANRDKSVGDVEFENVGRKASLITPVPGGVGPIVITAVLKNLVTLVEHD
jgi:methylenetetrahydrofolate dehydrogenase (NADP+)/methenyltetrahydrofolate cyclohydrolase